MLTRILSSLSPEQCAVVIGGTLFFCRVFPACYDWVDTHPDGVLAMPSRRARTPMILKMILKRCTGSVLAGSLLLIVGAGCQKTVLRPDDHRSQFDRYDQSRNQRAEPFLEDEFGRRTPNLRERLLEHEG